VGSPEGVHNQLLPIFRQFFSRSRKYFSEHHGTDEQRGTHHGVQLGKYALFHATLQELGDLTNERLHDASAPGIAERSIAGRISDQMRHHPILLFGHFGRWPITKDGFQVGADIAGIEDRPGIHFMEPGKNV